jgi:hypothetical protein
VIYVAFPETGIVRLSHQIREGVTDTPCRSISRAPLPSRPSLRHVPSILISSHAKPQENFSLACPVEGRCAGMLMGKCRFLLTGY